MTKPGGWLLRVVLTLIGTVFLFVLVLVVGAVRDIRNQELKPAPTATPDPRQDSAWLKTPGGQLYAKIHNLYPSWDRKVWDIVAAHQLAIGMSAAQCEVSWGKPDKVNRTTTAGGTHEQWCYGSFCESALYLENGLLTAIQN